MAIRSMADAVRACLVKQAFVPGAAMGGDPAAGGMPPGGDPSMGGGMPMDPSMMGGMPPPGMDPSMMGGMPPPGMDPSMMGGMPMGGDPMAGGMPMGGDPMAGMPPADPAAAAPQSGMINMTADEFTKFIKQMMAAFGANGAAAQQPAPAPQADIGAKLDTLIAVMQANGKPPVM